MRSAAVCPSCSAAPPAPASSSRHNRSGVLQTPGPALQLHNRPYLLYRHSQLRLHVDHVGFRAREPAALHDVQPRVHTAMVPDLQLELSTSRCQVPGYTTFRFLLVNNVCVSVGFFMCASMPQGTHLLRVVRITGHKVSQRLHDDFPSVSRFKRLPTPPELSAVS